MVKLLGTVALSAVATVFVFASVVVSQGFESPCISTGPRCISSCRTDSGVNLEDGNYQWCEGCRFFAQCAGGVMYISPCGTNQVWHDLFKACLATSTTCTECIVDKPPTSTPPSSSTSPPIGIEGPCIATGPRCISSCITDAGVNLEDGNYQWCEGCSFFAQCAGGVIYISPCGANQVWHDLFKACLATSPTCLECIVYKPPTSTPPSSSTSPPIVRECETTGSLCIESCAGTQQGDYQWCGSCTYFLQCIGGVDHMTACPRVPQLVYDHSRRRCDYESTTCHCHNPEPA